MSTNDDPPQCHKAKKQHFPILSAKWSSNEDVSSFGRGGRGSSGGGSGADSPFLKADKRRDFKPVNFDSNSLKRNNSGKENVSGNSQVRRQ